MSSNNIDDIFKEGLSDFKETPPAFVWDAIESDLQGHKKNRKAIVLWRSIAAAAVIGILLLGGLLWTNNNNQKLLTNASNNVILIEDIKSKNQIIHTPKSLNKPDDIQNPNSIIKNVKSQDYSISYTDKPASKESKGTLINKGQITNNKNELVIKTMANKGIEIINQDKVNATHTFNKTNQDILNSKAIESLNYARYNAATNEDENKRKELQFALGGQFSPSYSSNSSSSVANISASNEDGIMSYTGGINLNIQARKKWSVETGIYYSQVGQKFSNPLVESNRNGFYSIATKGGIKSAEPNLSNSMGEINLNQKSNQNLLADAAYSSTAYELNSAIPNNDLASNNMSDITVQQELDYIEVPFLLKYSLVDKTIGISLSGGMSTNFLIGNSAYQLNNSNKEKIGEMNNMNEVNYTAIFGFGISAPIFKSLDFNLEPRIRYFMNSVSNSGNYQPYSIGLYTGVSYKF